MSVVELNVLKQRLQQGMEAKARRGELFRMLPPGYVCDASGKVVKDPDERVQQAIALVFAKFRETVEHPPDVLWFQDEGIEMPVNKSVGGTMQHRLAAADAVLHQRRAAQSVLRRGLHLRSAAERDRLRDGRLVRASGPLLRARGMSRLHPRPSRGVHLLGDLRGESADDARTTATGATETRPSRRSALDRGFWRACCAAGAAVAGCTCATGARRGTRPRYLCEGDFDAGGKYCLGFGGRASIARFGEELLRVLCPLGVRGEPGGARAGSRRRTTNGAHALALQLEQLEYEAQRAFEQYDEVDPRNRLVAAELERRWNDKLEEVEKLKAALAELDATAAGADRRGTRDDPGARRAVRAGLAQRALSDGAQEEDRAHGRSRR